MILQNITKNTISEHLNFKFFLGGHAHRPPRLSCYAAKLRLALPLSGASYGPASISLSILVLYLYIP